MNSIAAGELKERLEEFVVYYNNRDTTNPWRTLPHPTYILERERKY